MFGILKGAIAFVWFLLTIGVLYLIWTGNKPSTNKLVWTIGIVVLPYLGPFLWMLFGYEGKKTS